MTSSETLALALFTLSDLGPVAPSSVNCTVR